MGHFKELHETEKIPNFWVWCTKKERKGPERGLSKHVSNLFFYVAQMAKYYFSKATSKPGFNILVFSLVANLNFTFLIKIWAYFLLL